jgi:8-oxo-dGTP pyrophosphatase MutT (NUDIX family)
MPREISAGAVIFRKEKNKIYYLLLHHKPFSGWSSDRVKTGGHWSFPKGHIEKGENETETIKREVKEETDLKDIKIIKGFREQIKYFFRDIYSKTKVPENTDEKELPWILKIVIYYLAEANTEKVKISFEHIDYKWLPYEKAIKQLTFKQDKEILSKANSFLLNNN